MIKVTDVLKEFKNLNLIIEVIGNPEASFENVSSVENCGPKDLTFLENPEFLQNIIKQKPSVVVTNPKLKDQLKETQAVLVTANVRLAHALIKKKYADRDFTKSGWVNIHPSAVVHETAKLGESVVVEPKAVIGKNALIGKNTRIMAGAVIENDVEIGQDCVIHPNVVIGYKCKLGNEVVIEGGSVIGSQGYGFAQDEKKRSYQIPQTGIVVIEDRVRVGANNCIDRAAYGQTRIGAGTKLDNLCHVAHNVQIGEDCILTAFFCVAGSTKIGDRMVASGQTGIIDHLNICNDVTLLHKAGVTKDITVPGAYAGIPLQNFSDYTKNAAVLKNASELRKKVLDLEKELKNK
ncbi:MAG: UDP-3-O-(3-hydroxymyristoyl)glucosamine N-acyltransferase [Oligoflexia bacterium]|nr:UDP-3-O-(3-hydroxymyristoyl)glucosamine N-acyltransferase [Oligoflexia bacterium]